MAAKMSHLAVQRFTTSGLKYSRSLRVSLVKPYSLRYNRAAHPLTSILNSSDYRRAFMNSSEDASKKDDSAISPDEILNQCSRLYDSLSNLNDKLGGMAIPKSSPHTRWVQIMCHYDLCLVSSSFGRGFFSGYGSDRLGKLVARYYYKDLTSFCKVCLFVC